MAGMLPGVESARRRRLHQSGANTDCPYFTRRSSLCLYSTKQEFLLSSSSSSSSSSSLQQRGVLLYQARIDERLAGAAGEAKERLDERLRSVQMISSNKSQNIKEKKKSREGRPELHIEVYGSKKSGGSRIFNWRKMSWKASDQEDCAVCLESFKVGETLIHLPCAHKFHCSCLEPWLQNNSYCPCCRTSVFISH